VSGSILVRGTAEDLGIRYWRDGYATVTNRFPADEVAAWRAECERLWTVVDTDPDAPRVQWRGHVREGQIRDRIDPVVDISPLFAALAADSRLVTSVRQVLRAEPALMKAKLITKRPGTAGYAMHQDFPYWAPLGIPADDLLTLQVSIDAARSDNGAVELFGRLHHGRLESRPNEPLDVDESRMDVSRGHLAELSPGDLLLFHSLTPHRSGPNCSTAPRRALFFTYTTAGHGDIYRRYHEQQGIRHSSVQ
jgi:ectoine hydroxylase-related dioxygenase (phytanoyl-CoA dioxygenase family)